MPPPSGRRTRRPRRPTSWRWSGTRQVPDVGGIAAAAGHQRQTTSAVSMICMVSRNVSPPAAGEGERPPDRSAGQCDQENQHRWSPVLSGRRIAPCPWRTEPPSRRRSQGPRPDSPPPRRGEAFWDAGRARLLRHPDQHGGVEEVEHVQHRGDPQRQPLPLSRLATQRWLRQRWRSHSLG